MSRLFDRAAHQKGFPSAYKEANCLFAIAFERKKSAIPLLKNRLNDDGALNDGRRPLLVWAIWYIDPEGTASFLVELLEKGDKPIFTAALRCMERLAFQRSTHGFKDRAICGGEWKEWVRKDQNESWNTRLAQILKRTDLGDGLGLCELTVTAADWRPPWSGLGREASEDAKGTQDLVLMRLSELLCAESGVYSISPAAFPWGVIDPVWETWDQLMGGGQWMRWQDIRRSECGAKRF